MSHGLISILVFHVRQCLQSNRSLFHTDAFSRCKTRRAAALRHQSYDFCKQETIQLFCDTMDTNTAVVQWLMSPALFPLPKLHNIRTPAVHAKLNTAQTQHRHRTHTNSHTELSCTQSNLNCHLDSA